MAGKVVLPEDMESAWRDAGAGPMGMRWHVWQRHMGVSMNGGSNGNPKMDQNGCFIIEDP